MGFQCHPQLSKQLFSAFHLSVVSLFNIDEYLFDRAVILHQDLIEVHSISSFWLSHVKAIANSAKSHLGEFPFRHRQSLIWINGAALFRVSLQQQERRGA
jgi:hypothetical protein